MPIPPAILRNTFDKPEKGIPRWYQIIPERDIARFRRAARRTNLSVECLECKLDGIPILRHLTPTSYAALVDSACGSLLMLPMALYLGGNINQVDSEGRTLLHFAKSRRVARYLIEQGVPVAPGMQGALIGAFDQPSGTASFSARTKLGVRDNRGREPSILATLRHGATSKDTYVESAAIPQENWPSTLAPHLYNGMLGLGFNEDDDVRAARDPHARTRRPALRAELSMPYEVSQAIHEHSGTRLRALLDLGADPNARLYSAELRVGGKTTMGQGVSAAALAVMSDCEHIDDDRGLFDEDDPARDDPLPEQDLLVHHLAGSTDFTGVHGPGGLTLMHLATEVQIAQWLITQGAPCDVKDERGRLPEDVLQGPVAALVTQARLLNQLPAASARPVRRRL